MYNEETPKELVVACEQLKQHIRLSDTQLEFLSEVCYINRGMWVGDTNELIRSESKRELALTLKSIRDCTAKELAELYKENGEAAWIIKIMTQLTANLR